jgi:hypothetical protein
MISPTIKEGIISKENLPLLLNKRTLKFHQNDCYYCLRTLHRYRSYHDTTAQHHLE